MKKLTFLPTLVLAALTVIFPAHAVELVKADVIDNTSLTLQAKQMLTIEIKKMHVKTNVQENLKVVKNALDEKVKATVVNADKSSNYAINLAD